MDYETLKENFDRACMLLEEKENCIAYLQGELEVGAGKVGELQAELGELGGELGKEKIHNEEKTKTITRLTKVNKNLDDLYSSVLAEGEGLKSRNEDLILKIRELEETNDPSKAYMSDLEWVINENDQLKVKLSEIKEMFDKRELEIMGDFDQLSKCLKERAQENKDLREALLESNSQNLFLEGKVSGHNRQSTNGSSGGNAPDERMSIRGYLRATNFELEIRQKDAKIEILNEKLKKMKEIVKNLTLEREDTTERLGRSSKG